MALRELRDGRRAAHSKLQSAKAERPESDEPSLSSGEVGLVIAIDVGCARYGGDFSLERMLEEFSPRVLYGFDPNWDESMFSPPDDLTSQVIVQKAAAWTYDGEIGFEGSGLGGHLAPSPRLVPCIDLSKLIRSLGDESVVLKIDAEGAEYELLEHLIGTNADLRLELAWVEWHPPGARVNSRPDERRDAIEAEIACEIVEWRW